MAADIYVIFRQMIGDTTPDYTLADLQTLEFLDRGINKASEVLDFTIKEDIVISTADITNGYVDLSYEIVTINSTELGLSTKGEYWEEGGGKRIRFIDTASITAGTYEFVYQARYKKFDGEVRENNYFDYPRNVDLGIVFWALAEYQVTKGLINANDIGNLVVSKSEEGMSESYGTGTALKISSPSQLRKQAMIIFNSASNKSNINFSISI